MKVLQFIRRHIVGIVTLLLTYGIVRYLVIKNRMPGSMTVIEAQAMDMSAASGATPIGAIPVAAEEVGTRLFAPTVTYTGTAAAYNDAEVFPRVAGTLTAVYVYPGDRVRAGQPVARLDSVELASRSDEAAAAEEAARHEVNISSEERRQATAMKRSVEAKARAARGGLTDAKSQLTSATAMRDQAEREQEAAQAGLADVRANVTAMEADADYWTRELAREEKLLKAGAVSRDEYDRESAQAKSAQAKLTQARASVREKQAGAAAAQAKIRQAEAGISSAQAKIAQAQADTEGAQADVSAASANVDLNLHHTAHKSAQLKQMAAQARTAKIVEDYTLIRAVQDGTVTDRLVSPGTLVQPGTAILKIKSADRVRLQANVSEADLAGIHVGTAVTITKPAVPDFRFRTRIMSIFSAANPQARTVTVEAIAPNPDRRFVPGEYIVMEIATAAPRKAITVPAEAVHRDVNQKPFVWSIAVTAAHGGKTIYTCVMHPEVLSHKPGKCPKCGMELTPKVKSGKFSAHRLDVVLGTSDGKRVVVERGLNAGQQIIFRGHENLHEGDPVTAVDWSTDGPKSLAMPTGEGGGHEGMKMDGMGAMPGMGGR